MATPPPDNPAPVVNSRNNSKKDAEPGAVPTLPDNDFDSRRKLFNGIYSTCSPEVAKQASRAERENTSLLDNQSLTYGEVDIASLHELLDVVKRQHGSLHSGKGAFLDLGSGAGKAVIAAGLLHPFSRVVGIEKLECLSDFALGACERYKAALLPDGVLKPEVQILKGDFVELLEGQELQDLAPEVAICLSVSTCYGEEQMQALAKFAKLMASGSFIITFTQTLPDCLLKAEARGWSLVHSSLMQMMWGPSTVFIYKKVPVTEAAGPGVAAT
jgi:hypothetical protein